jgi:hypothetical protein
MMLAAFAALAVCGLLAVVAGAHSLGRLATDAAKRPERLVLVYVGADDCAPCRTWQREAAPLLRSPAFARLLYREVKSPSSLDLMRDTYWPDDLRGLRGQLEPGAGIPLWLVIADGEIVGRGQGASQWQATILPKLRSLLR